MRSKTIDDIVFTFLVAFVLTACHSPARISGRLENTEGKNQTIYLIQPETLWEVGASYFGKVIDSAITDEDGRFEFQNLQEAKDSLLLEIAVQPDGKRPNYFQTDNPIKSNYMPIFWNGKEDIRITSKLNGFQNSFSIEHPSTVNKALMHLRDINQKAYQTYLDGRRWDVENGSELLEKEHAISQYQNELIHFADSTEYLVPAMVALRWVSPVNDYERVPEFLVRQCAKWNNKQPYQPFVKQLCEFSETSNLPVLVGDEFPNLKLPTLSKDTLNLQDQLGSKLTIIDLWASWCAPCRKENREVLAPLWDEYHDRGLQIIAYGLESDETAWKAATAKDGANRWLQASDLQGDDAPFLKKIRVQTIPANFILNDQGVVIAKNVHGDALIQLVKNQINE